MTSLQKTGLLVIVLAAIIWVGCNDIFRPIVIPIPTPGPDPQRNAHAYVLSNTGPGTLGALSTIDIGGDTISTVQYAGLGSIDVQIQPAGVSAYVVNQTDDTLTQLNPTDLTVSPTTIPLPAGAAPVYAYSLTADRIYVAEPGRNKVAHITVSNQTLADEITVGSNPIAITETPNAQQVYVVNHGDNTVSVIKTADDTVLGTIPVGTSPVAAVASSDGAFVFVANEGSNDVTVIDTTNSTTALGTIALGASPGCAGQVPCFSITYDKGLKRVYTANRANNTISIIRADLPYPTMPTLLTPAPGLDVTAAPCSGSSPRQVAVLPDGSKAYVVNGGTDNVCVLSSLSNTFTTSIALPAGAAPTAIAAATDGTKVYTSNPGTQNVSIMAPVTDTLVTSLGSPKTNPNCQDPAPPAPPICSHMNPVYVTAQ